MKGLKGFSIVVIVTFVILAGCNEYSFYQELGDPIPEGATIPSLGLSIQPSSATVYIGEKVTFYATGGVEPYSYSVVNGSDATLYGTIDEDTGVYTAPLAAIDAVTVRVTDSDSNTSDATVTVIDYPAFTVYPTSMKVYEGFTMEVTGGIPPYTFEVIDGGGTIDSSTGVYDAPGYSDTVTVRVKDSAGRPDEVTFPVRWNRETVDDGSGNVVGLYSSLKMDSSGNPHIAYYDSTNGNLDYAYWNGSSWNVEVADSTGDVGKYCSLALDSLDDAHVSYYDTAEDLYHIKRQGGTWLARDTITSSGTIRGRYSSIALDSSGNYHISYLVDLKLYYYSIAQGEVEVDNTSGAGFYTSIAIDNNGFPGISYRNNTTKELKYAYYNGSSWIKQTLPVTGDTGYYTSLAFDSKGNPHISFYDADNQDVEYISYDGTSWGNPEVVDTNLGDCVTGVYGNTSLVIDSNDVPHIAYYNANKTALMYAFKESDGTWHTDVVDNNGNVGQYLSIALYVKNGRERVAFSYYDEDNGALKYAY